MVCLGKKPKISELQLFFLNSLEDLVRKTKITGTPAETVDILSVVHRSYLLEVAFVALFCITKPQKTLEVDLTHVQKNLKALLNYFLTI